jgi:Skp family chaperone for outer membrane proteins
MGDEAAAIRSFLTAQKMEEAGLYRAAAMDYRAVLRCVSDRVPTKQAAERIKELNAKHPEAFQVEPKQLDDLIQELESLNTKTDLDWTKLLPELEQTVESKDKKTAAPVPEKTPVPPRVRGPQKTPPPDN